MWSAKNTARLYQERNRLCRIGNKENMIKDCKSVHNILAIYYQHHRLEDSCLFPTFYNMKNQFWAGLGSRAVLMTKKFGANYEQLLRTVLLCFYGQKKIYIYCSIGTEKFHRKKANFFLERVSFCVLVHFISCCGISNHSANQ